MAKSARDRLKVPYSPPATPGSHDVRLTAYLKIDIANAIRLGDLLEADLDVTTKGVGWWSAYTALDRKIRILISDHLLGCARAISTNILEAYAERLEFDDAIVDFQNYMERGVSERRVVTPRPRGPYDDMATPRVTAHFCGVLRALASSLDVLGACVVGVAGLPTGIVKADLTSARERLAKVGDTIPRLRKLQTDLEACEDAAGPSGWMAWLLAMRNTDIHRARRVITWDITRGAGGLVEGIYLKLPRSPELTEIQACVYAGGTVGTHFEVRADAFLDRLAATVYSYVNGATGLLCDLWNERRSNPSLIEQPASQWKDPALIVVPTPTFGGYPELTVPSSTVSEIALPAEMFRRLTAAGITERGVSDLLPSPQVWN